MASGLKRPCKKQKYDLNAFKESASKFAMNEEEALMIKINETNKVSEIFPRYSKVETNPDLHHLKLEGFNRDEILTFVPTKHSSLSDDQRRFLTKLRHVLINNEVDVHNSKCELYIQAMIDILLQQCKLDDALSLEMLPSVLRMYIGDRSFATQSDREGRKDGQLVWVLQESKHKNDTRYRGGDIQLVSAIIAACQQNYSIFGGHIFPQTMYGINVKGDEVSVMRTVIIESYLLHLFGGLPQQPLIVNKYPKDARLKLSSYKSRCEILCLMTKLRKYALSVDVDVPSSL